MCGIAGIVAEPPGLYEPFIQRMIGSLHHRGPDSQGFYNFPKCSLGHVRLSIIDLQTGQQPMLNNATDKGLVFNGEIYGYQHIRNNELSAYPFKTNSDTEVILALYEKYDKQFLEHLPGAFSFAIWDNAKQELICARDRFGEKPFYYAFGNNNEFIFASEIKAILASGLVDPVLDKNSLGFYLKNLYVSPSGSIYKNIFVLPPAHMLTYKNGKISRQKYWQIPETRKDLNFEEACYKFKNLLTQSVEKQLIADVPVSAFLSGGLDSSTIVAIASRFHPNINVFTFGFGKNINETGLAKKTAQKYHLKLVELEAENFHPPSLLQKMQDVFDEPFADSSNIPSFLIAREASRHSKVVLTGDGGDELLGGYAWYPPLLKIAESTSEADIFKAFFEILKLNAARLFNKRTNRYKQNIRNLADVRLKSVSEYHYHQRYLFSEAEIKQMLPIHKEHQREDHFKPENTLNDAMKMDLTDYMPGDILVKIDRSSMANSLELRAPFLDIELAEFCISLPAEFKITSRATKKILRQTFQDSWIDELKTVNKQGFGAPVDEWLKSNDFQDLIKKCLLNPSSKIYQLLDFSSVKKFLHANNYKTWALLNLALWAESHKYSIDG